MTGLDLTNPPAGFISHCKDGHDHAAQTENDGDCEPVPFPIAVVGMSMRLPGGINCEADLWDLLINKRDGRCMIPEDRYNIEAFYDESRPGAIRTQHGYFLQQDISHVDAAFFGMSKIEAAKLDPQQRILLEVIWECLENAGQIPAQCRGKNIGCYVGVFGEDWLDLMSKDTQSIDRFRVVSAADFALSNRVSYEFDLRGPSITFRTGCSSALVGLHDACQALYAGECSSALVAGTNLIITPTTTTAMSETMALSPSGVSRTFDAAADGYGRGEAINAIYIKPLDACLRDGDPIRAVIRSTAVNCDGKTPSITTPGSQAQEALIRRAYTKARIDDLARTAFFECHGTGTIVGDTAETSVIAKVFGKDGIHIGAVKPNLGHSEGASGITSVIKSVLALEHRTIPPNIHFKDPNPNIPFQEAKLQVPVEPTPWPADRSERISVNSFGIGGTNAHLVLDSAYSVRGEPVPQAASSDRPGPHLLIASAKSTTSLDRSIQAIRSYLEATPSAVADLSYTLALKREHMQHRAFAIADKDGAISTFEKARAVCPQICFVFTGQGAQWPGMGREMILSSKIFRLAIRALDQELQGLDNSPDWSIEEELLHTDDKNRFLEAKFAQPLCTAVQLATVDFLDDLGVRPSVVSGHSSGEIAAAYASGAITAATAIKIAYLRGLAMDSTNENGTMAAVGLGRTEVEPYLREGVVVACENSPQSVTISGDKEKIDDVLNEMQAKGEIFCRRLAVNVAYHSHHMHDAGILFESLLSEMPFNRTMIPLVSTVTNETISDPCCLSPSYWRKNVESPVLFNTAIQKILRADEQTKLFVEIGPHSALSGPLRQIISDADAGERSSYTPTFVRGSDQWSCLLATVGQLHTRGVPVQLSGLIGRAATLTDLAPYPWDHNESFWNESRLTRDWRLRQAPHHELLGSRALESSDLEPVWRNMLQLENVTWILDHKVGGEIVFPAAGYVAMVGEAIRQISRTPQYSVRNMFMRTGLVLKETNTQAVEIITSLRPAKLTDHLDSGWYDFTITAHHDGVWKKHCVGQIRAEPDGVDCDEDPVVAYARKVPANEWYEALENRGLEYGPQFRGLHDITASPTSTEAAAMLGDASELSASRYALHPVVIDQCLQLLSVAGAQGIKRCMTRLCIPTAIESLYIATGQGSMSLKARCDASGSTMTGDTLLVADEKPVLSIKRCFFFGIGESALNDDNGPSAATLHWKPHVDLVQPEVLLPSIPHNNDRGKLIAEFTMLFILEAYHQTKSSSPAKEHLKKYHRWLSSQYEKIRDEDPGLVPEMREKSAPDPQSRLPRIRELGKAIKDPLGNGVYTAAEEVLSNIQGIMDGTISALEIIMGSDAIRFIYEESSRLCCPESFLSLLSHSRPTLKVLEVGAGTGGATAGILDGLFSTIHKSRMYSSYTFTDISAGFFSRAKERFKSFPGLQYQTLDISADPEEQGFTTGEYDLIVACNVVHATPRISETLRNLHKLLAPGGWLFLTELCPTIPFNYIMGTLPGWWSAEDSREIPLVSVAQWHQSLLDAGFTGVDVVRYDVELPYNMNAYMISRRPRATRPLGGYISFLHSGTVSSWARNLEQAFLTRGVNVHWFTLDNLPSSIADVISLIDLDCPFFDRLSNQGFHAFKEFISRVKGSCLWLMRPVQLDEKDPDPRFALALGFMRTARKEFAAGLSTLELDQKDTGAAEKVIQVFQKVYDDKHESLEDRDHEFVLQDGAIHVGRFQYDYFQDLMTSSETLEPRSLDIGCFGMLDTLTWALDGRGKALGERDVEVEICFVGLNFRDMMISMGLMGDTSQLGLEAAGIVRNVGSEVRTIRVGDRVSMLGKGLMGTRKIVPASCCLVIPEEMSLEDAAAGPCVFSTVIYSLMNCGNLQKGQTILIHSACGGVGLAAIQLCQLIGADIFATVGSEEKRKHLMEIFNIAEDHIFDSRSISFERDVLKMTGNRGVDLVLNSLSGELLHASWRCVAPMGKMIELGKRDLLGHGKLDMDLFGGNRTFMGVDLLQLGEQNPTLMQNTMEEFKEYIDQGKLRPIRPVNMFKVSDIAKAFRLMQTGKHIGKIVLEMPRDPSKLPVSKLKDNAAIFRHDASYLLVGGLGGLGRSVARWMLEKGARHLVFMSRSGLGPSKNREFIEDLESQVDCHITTVIGDVTNAKDVARAVSGATRPLAGVMQMSMVLRDQTLDKMTYEEWTEVLAPKVQGTWNLHHAVEGQPLEFFILFSSISGIVGNSGQVNYSAANTFLDAFVTYRRSKGLPASVLDLGFMGDVGFVYENSRKLLDLARLTSWEILRESDLLRALEIQIIQGTPQLAIGMGTTKPPAEIKKGGTLAQDARFLAWHNMLTATGGGDTSQGDELKALVASIKRDPALLYDPATEIKITLEIGRMIATNMSYPTDMAGDDLLEITIDSLMTMEIRSWFRRKVGIEVSIAEISNAGTVKGLGAITMKTLRERHNSGELENVKREIAGNESRKVDEVALFREDMALAKTLQSTPGPVPCWHSESEGRVFLTGAPGFLASFFLSQLSAIPQVKEIACLVRAEDASTGMSRIKESLEHYGLLLEFESKIIAVPGDISDPTFKLGQEKFEYFAQWASVIFHLAARSTYTLPYSSHRDANVYGMFNMLRFANTKRLKPLHYSSSLSACGASVYLDGGRLVPENERPAVDDMESFMKRHVGYSQSKVVAESIAWNAISNGMPVTLYRLPLITGHSKTGTSNVEDAFNRLMASSIRIGCYPTCPDARCQLIPVDFACSAILQISLGSDRSHAYNVVMPDQTQTLTWDETLEMVGQSVSPPLKRVPPSEWTSIFATHAEKHLGVASLYMQERLKEALVFWQADNVEKTVYENTNCRRALAESPEVLKLPSMPDLLKVYFTVWSKMAEQ